MIVEVGINPRFYPKGYTQPKKWMKKFFRIKKQMIPKYLYIQLVLSIALVVFEFVNIFIYLCNIVIYSVIEMHIKNTFVS